MSRTLIIGVGNPNRGDDAVGRCVARAALRADLSSVDVVEQSGEAMSLMEAWAGYERVILIDAMNSGVAVGSVVRIDPMSQALNEEAWSVSTHGIGLAEAIELARNLGNLPASVVVYGVEGREFQMGAPMSSEVEGVIQSLAERVVGDCCAD